MTDKSSFRKLMPILLLFVILNAVALLFTNRLAAWNINGEVVIVGNLLLFCITLLSFWMARKGLQNKNPHAFTRSVYGSIMVKLFLCMIAALIYTAINKKELNKPGLFICMGLYLVYTFLEVAALTKMLRQKPNE